MRCTFNGTEITPGGYDRADGWLTRLTIAGEQAAQISRPVRADYATPYARGGRLHTITLTITPPPAASSEAALSALLLYFSTLPQSGALVIGEDALQVTWPDAVLTNFAPPPRRGLANEYPLSFIAGANSSTTLSTLATMNTAYVWNLPGITGLTGGGATKLDGLITADVAVGCAALITPTISGLIVPKTFRLAAGTTAENADPTAGALVIRPDDYNAGTNAKVWLDVSL